MGKKKTAPTKDSPETSAPKTVSVVKASKKKVVSGTLYVESTYNNTKISLTDKEGKVIFWSSSGAVGFKGAKKGTPFAAAKVGEVIGEKAVQSGLKEADVVVRGVGSGRESAIRGFISKGIDLTGIKDQTPVPHNGPKPKKPRTV